MAPRLPVLNQCRTVAKCDPRLRRGPRCYLATDSMNRKYPRAEESSAKRRRNKTNGSKPNSKVCLKHPDRSPGDANQKTRISDTNIRIQSSVQNEAAHTEGGFTSATHGGPLSIERLNTLNATITRRGHTQTARKTAPVPAGATCRPRLATMRAHRRHTTLDTHRGEKRIVCDCLETIGKKGAIGGNQ